VTTLAEALAFLGEHHRAVLVTHRQGDGLQTSPIAASADDEGHVLISTRETAMKAKNVARDPRVTLCAIADDWYSGWVQVDGTAEIVHLPEAMDLLVDYYRRVAGEHPDWDDYRAAMEREQRVILRITAGAVGPNVAG
jgi:PPOX class probable F420-dependent enzyme